jgi:hypothetical protein
MVSGCQYEAELSELVIDPTAWVGKDICFEGRFSSFSTLALDYPPAMRSRTEYISITLQRPGTDIPLGEVKLAMDLEDVQNHAELSKAKTGDPLRMRGKVFSDALAEPWIELDQVQVFHTHEGFQSAEGDEDPETPPVDSGFGQSP